MGKRANHEGSIFQSADGKWNAVISLGRDAQGRRRRRRVVGKTQREVKAKLAQLRQDAESGLRGDARAPTVSEWASTWLGVVERTRKPSTAKTYSTHLKYLEPIRGLRLDKVTSEDLEDVYVGLDRRGVKPISVQSAHRTFSSCFNEAVKRGWILRNPVKAARPNSAQESEVDPLSVREARAILAAAQGRRNGARWSIALSLGLRQGEALGLQWDDIDFEKGSIRVRRALQHGRWIHGCSDVDECAGAAYKCPLRHGGGLLVTPPKSKRATRLLPLPGPLLGDLRSHRSAQASERLVAGECWEAPPRREGLNTGSGWVFSTPTGRPIDARRDWDDWKTLLNLAGVRSARLHDARHTAATFLLVAGVDSRTVMDLMGWSQPVLLMRYQHVVDDLKREAAGRIAGLLWSDEASPMGDGAEGGTGF